MHHQGTIRLNNVTSTLVFNCYTMEMHFNPPVKSGFRKMNRKKASFERFSASSRLQTTIEQSSLSIYCTEVIVWNQFFQKRFVCELHPSRSWGHKYEQKYDPPANKFFPLKQTVAGIESWLDDALVTLCWDIEIPRTHAVIVRGT